MTIIFDLDGTIIDSMWVWDGLAYNYLRSKGYSPKDDLVANLSKLSYSESPAYLKKEYKMLESEGEILEDLNMILEDHYRNKFLLKDNALRAITYLHEKNYRLGIGTATELKWTKIVLEKYGLTPYFEFIETEASFLKTDKNFYLNLCKKLGARAQDCYFIDDSPFVLEAAKEAGLRTIAIRDESYLGYRELFKKFSDYYIENLIELEELF